MGNPQKTKGDNYERELAAWLNENVYDGRTQCGRAPLSGGGFVGLSGGADLIGTPGLFVEAKRVEKLNFMEALRQAEGNIIKTHSPEAAIVINRRNRMTTGESLILMRLDRFSEFYKSWLIMQGHTKAEPISDRPVGFKPMRTGE